MFDPASIDSKNLLFIHVNIVEGFRFIFFSNGHWNDEYTGMYVRVHSIDQSFFLSSFLAWRESRSVLHSNWEQWSIKWFEILVEFIVWKLSHLLSFSTNHYTWIADDRWWWWLAILSHNKSAGRIDILLFLFCFVNIIYSK